MTKAQGAPLISAAAGGAPSVPADTAHRAAPNSPQRLSAVKLHRKVRLRRCTVVAARDGRRSIHHPPFAFPPCPNACCPQTSPRSAPKSPSRGTMGANHFCPCKNSARRARARRAAASRMRSAASSRRRSNARPRASNCAAGSPSAATRCNSPGATDTRRGCIPFPISADSPLEAEPGVRGECRRIVREQVRLGGATSKSPRVAQRCPGRFAPRGSRRGDSEIAAPSAPRIRGSCGNFRGVLFCASSFS